MNVYSANRTLTRSILSLVGLNLDFAWKPDFAKEIEYLACVSTESRSYCTKVFFDFDEIFKVNIVSNCKNLEKSLL